MQPPVLFQRCILVADTKYMPKGYIIDWIDSKPRPPNLVPLTSVAARTFWIANYPDIPLPAWIGPQS